MKKYLFPIAMALVFSLTCLAQKEEKEAKNLTVPIAAKASLLKAFPGYSNIKWEKENANYEANFKQNGKKMSAVFDNNGTLLEWEITMKPGELPASILLYVKEHYKGVPIKEAAKITKSNGDVNYEAEVNKVDVMFDVNGKFIKEEKD
ncbi:MAG: hypothetical protein ABIN89_27985 [Chitinophagaceae bacterium]